MNRRHCPSCELQLPPESKFCSHCSLPLTPQGSATIVSNEWRPAPDEFAARILPRDLHALLAGKGLNVDESQTGLLLENGRFVYEMTAGRHTLQSFADRIRGLIAGHTVVAVLVRKGLFPLNIRGYELTPEAHKVAWSCEVGLEIADRNAFYIHFMQSRAVITSADILERTAPAARLAIHGMCQSCSSSELHTMHPELHQRLIDSIADAVSAVCARLGLRVAYVNVPEFRNDERVATQLERARYINDLRERRLTQEYERKRSEIEAGEYKAKQVLLDARFDHLINDAERTAEYEKLKSDIRQKGEFHRMQLAEAMASAVDEFAALNVERQDKNRKDARLRAHLLATVELTCESELATSSFALRKILLEQQHELDDSERQTRIAAADVELKAELNRIEQTDAAKQSGWKRRKQVENDVSVLDARTQAAIRLIAADTDRAIARADFDHEQTAARTNADLQFEDLVRHSDLQQQRLKQQQLLQNQIQADEQRVRQAEHERTAASKLAERDHDRVRLQLMQDMPEAFQLMETARAAGDNPALMAMLAPALKMAMAQGLTADQLELLTAGESPEFARTLQEKYKSQMELARQAESRQLELFERMLQEMQNSHQLSQQQQASLVDRLERMGTEAQHLLRDVGIQARQENPSAANVDPNAIARLEAQVRQLVQGLTGPKSEERVN